MEQLQNWLIAIAASPWVYPALFALVVSDAFLVIVPSETMVVALGAVAASTGAPNLVALIAVAAVGAMVGDQLCYLIGRWIGTERWAWMRGRRIHAALEVARRTLDSRAAVVLLTARYIPFARIAVNLTAGATRFSHARFTVYTAIAGVAWGCFNVGIGAGIGSWLGDQPLLAVLISVPVAIVVGLAIDTIVRAVSKRHERRGASRPDGDTAADLPVSEPADPA